jgi:SsrA-binding protein
MPTLAHNKEAAFHYEILEKFEAGIKLSGPEVKAAKLGQINLRGSYVSFIKNEPFLVNAHINPYKPAAGVQKDYSPTQTRKLLLRQKEINYLRGKTGTAGLTIIPLSVYTKGGLVKIEIALARGKKLYDKRESIKKREVQRQIQRRMREKI